MCVTQSGSVQPATATAIIVIGGRGDSGSTLSSGERFDPAQNAWSPIRDSSARAYHATAVIDGLLYTIGGDVSSSYSSSYSSSSERYDLAQNAWSPIASMGAARDDHASTPLR